MQARDHFSIFKGSFSGFRGIDPTDDKIYMKESISTNPASEKSCTKNIGRRPRIISFQNKMPR